MKCPKCRHFYRRMVDQSGHGYNPFPCCWFFEDTGRQPNVLTQECFEMKRKVEVRNAKG